MDAPWGVCAAERQYRSRQASLARPFDQRQTRRCGLQLGWFVGVDWGSQTHQACVTDAAGEVVAERAFEHGGQGLSEMADWLLSMAGGDPTRGTIGLGLYSANAERRAGLAQRSRSGLRRWPWGELVTRLGWRLAMAAFLLQEGIDARSHVRLAHRSNSFWRVRALPDPNLAWPAFS